MQPRQGGRLHQGLDPQGWLWPGVREILFADLEKLHERCGPWDLVLFSGDLVEYNAGVYTGDAQLAEWPATLDRMLELGGDDAVYVPGHGGCVDAAFVRAQRAWLTRQL